MSKKLIWHFDLTWWIYQLFIHRDLKPVASLVIIQFSQVFSKHSRFTCFHRIIRSLPVTVTLEVKPADYSQIWNKIYGKSKLNSTEFKELAVLSWVLFIYLLHWFKILPEKSSKNLIERFIHKSCYLLTSIIKILNYIHGIIFI